MNKYFTLIRQCRQNIITLIDDLSDKELNTIPQGFNNNIIWNAGHLVTTVQLLCYKFSSLEDKLDNELVMLYRKGTKPKGIVEFSSIEKIRQKLLNSVQQIEHDYNNNLFVTYQPYETTFGIELRTIEDAIRFNVIHDGVHLGYIMAMKRLVKDLE